MVWEQICVCLYPYIPWKDLEIRHEEGDKGTNTYWEPMLDQGLEVGIVIYLLHMRKLRFRKTLALDDMFKMVEVTVGHPRMLSCVWKLSSKWCGSLCVLSSVTVSEGKFEEL